MAQSVASTGVKPWSGPQVTFQAWLALPPAERVPRQQQALAKQLGVTPETLSRWKREPGWNDAVYALAMDHVQSELGPILRAQVTQAKKGSLPHAQWVFEIAGKWEPKRGGDTNVNVGVMLKAVREVDLERV